MVEDEWEEVAALLFYFVAFVPIPSRPNPSPIRPVRLHRAIWLLSIDIVSR